MVVDEHSSRRACFAVGVAGACVGGTDGAGRAIGLSCSVVVLPSRATFAGNGFRGLSKLIVVLASAAFLTGNGFVVSIVLAGAAILTGN